jgi:lysophospholipase L1-like esterase
MKLYERELENFNNLNRVAKRNRVVLFGSTFAKNIPVVELKQSFNLECDIYNRSLTDLSIFDAQELVDKCVTELAPKKVLLQLGETDLERGYRSIPEMIKEYEKLIEKIRTSNKGCEIVIVSVCDSDAEIQPAEFNRQIEQLAKKTKCRFADISTSSEKTSNVEAFMMLKYFILDRLSFFDAMTLVNA